MPAQGQDLTQKNQRYRDRKDEAVQTVNQGLRAGLGTGLGTGWDRGGSGLAGGFS